MIGIIAALDKEIAGYEEILENKVSVRAANLVFMTGKLNGVDVTVVKSGIGKVAAALATAILIDRFRADVVINTGIAGGITARPLSVIVARDAVQHDFDLTADGQPLGHIQGVGTYLQSSPRLVEAFSSAIDGALVGTIATGDQFIASKEKNDFLRDTFGAIACDCESGAVLEVCNIAGVEGVSVRVISDGADEKAPLSYHELAEKASRIGVEAVSRVVSELY